MRDWTEFMKALFAVTFLCAALLFAIAMAEPVDVRVRRVQLQQDSLVAQIELVRTQLYGAWVLSQIKNDSIRVLNDRLARQFHDYIANCVEEQ